MLEISLLPNIFFFLTAASYLGSLETPSRCVVPGTTAQIVLDDEIFPRPGIHLPWWLDVWQAFCSHKSFSVDCASGVVDSQSSTWSSLVMAKTRGSGGHSGSICCSRLWCACHDKWVASIMFLINHKTIKSWETYHLVYTMLCFLVYVSHVS